MNDTLNWLLACCVCVFLIAFFLAKSSRESFRYNINDENGKNVLSVLTENLTRLTDSKKYAFSGELESLSRRCIMNEISFREGVKSFTENKQDVTLCLRDQRGEFYDMNSLMYVALHELAHVINDELQHTAKFRRIFEALLEHASGAGFYDPSKAFVRNYCL